MEGILHKQQVARANKWRALVFGASDGTIVQLARYTVVGGLAFGVDFSILYLLTDFGGVHYLVSAAIAFCGGLLVNYALSRAWVFERRSLNNNCLEFTVFAAIGLIGLAMNEAGMWLLTDILGLHYLSGKLFTTGFVFVWNFFARKYSLFR
jgi:putative flippase GtrA